MNITAFCHTEKSLTLMPDEHRDIVLALAQATNENLFRSPFEARDTFSSVLELVGVKVPDDIFANLEEDDSLEMWTSDLRFIFAMGKILALTSYSIDELASQPWHLLFSRSDLENARILARYEQAMRKNETQMDITPWHTVTEIRSPKRLSISARVEQITPFVSSRGFFGAIARVKSRPLLLT